MVLVRCVRRLQRTANAERAQQPAGVAGVLAQDHIGALQRPTRPRRHIAEVADRRGNQHKSGEAGRTTNEWLNTWLNSWLFWGTVACMIGSCRHGLALSCSSS